eukprot:TRINITY_DN31043_c0_g1_i1.p1 TRINITY_DN31043_c0_g1~~TRINITY_DN31043_c0_g1_i1.p1  ORF type:complete len:475 (+),score=39.53 TRINITY_DN31043_c0_g1_i1:38-1462(+)
MHTFDIQTDYTNQADGIVALTCISATDGSTCLLRSESSSTIGQVRDELKKQTDHNDILITFDQNYLDDDTASLSHVLAVTKNSDPHYRRGGVRGRIGYGRGVAKCKMPPSPPAEYFHRSPNERGRHTPPLPVSRFSDCGSSDGFIGEVSNPLPCQEYNHTPTLGTLPSEDDMSKVSNVSSIENGDGRSNERPPRGRCARFFNYLGRNWIGTTIFCVWFIGVGLFIIGVTIGSTDNLTTGECQSVRSSWRFSCEYTEDADWPSGWFAMPSLLANSDEPGRLGLAVAPKELQPNSKCDASIEIGRYNPVIPTDECIEYCTHWCLVKEQQVLDAAVGSICCEAVKQPQCTCAVHGFPSVIVPGNSSTSAVLYKFTFHEYSTDVTFANRRCVNSSITGIASEDECYLKAFRMLSWALDPFPCHTDDYIPKNGDRDERCYYGSVSDDSNPAGKPLFIVGLSLCGIICLCTGLYSKVKNG